MRGVFGTHRPDDRAAAAVAILAAWTGTWIARHQERTIAYLREENRVLREKVNGRVRLTDPERRRLARLGKLLGRKALLEVASIASPDTIRRWYRELVAAKYDGSARRGPGRPRTAVEIVRLLVEMASRNTGWGYTRCMGACDVPCTCTDGFWHCDFPDGKPCQHASCAYLQNYGGGGADSFQCCSGDAGIATWRRNCAGT